MHLTREWGRRIGGRKFYPSVDINGARYCFRIDIYSRAFSVYRVINIITEQKGIYSRRQWAPSLSRSISRKADRTDRISPCASQKNPPSRLRWYFIPPPFFSPFFPFFDSSTSVFYVLIVCDKIAITSSFFLFFPRWTRRLIDTVSPRKT